MFQKFSLFLFIFLLSFKTIIAKQKTIGVFDVDSVASSLPEYAEAKGRITEYSGLLDQAYDSMCDEYAIKIYELNHDSAKWTPLILSLKKSQITHMHITMSDFREKADKDISELTKRLMAPIYKRILTAAESIGKKKNYLAVLPTNKPLLWISEEVSVVNIDWQIADELKKPVVM